jgi:peptidyl-prolyl cis-trans isomerase SurA
MRRILGSLFVLAALTPLPGAAQAVPGEPEMVDRVVAIAGDSVVLLSQVEEEIARYSMQGIPIPDGPTELAEFRSELVEALVNRLLILQAALGDSTLMVSEEELEFMASQQLDQQVRRAGTQAALQQQLAQNGFSVSSYREFIKTQARQERLTEMYLQKARGTAGVVVVDEEEVRQAWEAQQGQIPPLAASVSAYQVAVEPQPSDSAVAAARDRARELLAELQAGEDFESLARRFSQDPGSAQQGGDLGWFRRGVMVEAFEDTAFRMRENQVSDVVETPFGAHIIKLERIRGGERKARHILIRAEVGPEDVERARQRAQELRNRVDGGESLASLRSEYGPPGRAALPDSISTFVDQLGNLPPAYSVLSSARPGEVLGPLEVEIQGRFFFPVLQITAVREAGPRTFDDVRDQLRAQLQQQKTLERILARLRERTFVEIRM